MQFVNSLAARGHVSSSTQNQALCAVLFLYREVLNNKLAWIDDIQWSKKPHRLPVVFTVEEVQKVITMLDGQHALMVSLLYGSGLRLMECMRLRIQELLGHKDVSTTMIYTHVLNSGGRCVKSPFDMHLG